MKLKKKKKITAVLMIITINYTILKPQILNLLIMRVKIKNIFIFHVLRKNRLMILLQENEL